MQKRTSLCNSVGIQPQTLACLSSVIMSFYPIYKRTPCFPKQKDGKISGNYQIAILLHDIFLLQKVGEGFVQLFLGQLQAEELCDMMTLAVGE